MPNRPLWDIEEIHDSQPGGRLGAEDLEVVLPGYEPEDRELFERAALELYDLVVQEGGISPNDPRLSEGSLQKDALDLLAELSLVQVDNEGNWQALEPSNVQSRVVTPLSTEGARLLDESARWAKAFQALGQSWKKSPQPDSSAPFTYLHGKAISPYITALLRDTEEELLTAQPQAGRGGPGLASAALRDIEALERGVSMRTLYQHSARRHRATREYVANVTPRGAEVRTLDEFFNRMIIVDRRVAVIPGKQDDLTTAIAIREPAVVDYLVDVFERAWERGRPFTSRETGLAVALSVREPSLVAYLVDIFERTWERARPFTNRESSMMRDIAAEQRAMTIRMLIEGHADPVSAKRLGVSPRTYAGYVADLKREYDAETRFQLGYVMGSQGVSGRERPATDTDADG